MKMRIPHTSARSTLEQSIPRACRFLRAASTDSAIAAALATVGFGTSDQKEGYDLLNRAVGLRKEAPVAVARIEAPSFADVERSLHFARSVVRGALGRLHPDQAAFLSGELIHAEGTTALVAARALLDRLDELESSPERKATRKVDHAAMATLARRGVTQAFRESLRKRVVEGEASKAPPALPPPPPPSERLDALRELNAWLVDWSECARGVISRRDQLLRLGIGKRAARKRATTPPPADVAPAPSATVAA